jgi:hypothetical protein
VFTRIATLALGLVLAATTVISAQPKLSPKPQGAEVAFVTGVQKDLMSRFATTKDAVNAGYFRYTDEDKTGAISYTNLQWESADPQHPSQLWYDAQGNLIGADYSVAKTDTKPSLWGVNPERWFEFHAHIHYVLTDASGKETYGGVRMAKFTAAGGDPKNPQADTLVKMGIAKDAKSVTRVFLFPALWDLEVWVKPNPNGAFAEMNPNVKPSANATDQM